ncbi:hypothetical protein CG740_34445 [Streptomyces sp. CB01201]|uniref:hypothetical protein n=1 Tax=Streptomyces sp. CB01201 TaxID=2020324 RepID=UPI000C27993B|nr:hypothetical protein [Streptomyces sp. CB01201]PJM98555.1 hypothetical protein CG740_34445 [Streptomyces sp. CB01201]
MRWWLKTRAPAAFLAAVIITTAFASLAGNRELPIPSLTGTTGTFLAGHLITVLPAAVLMYAASRTDIRMERAAARPIPAWNTLLGVMAALTAALAAIIAYAVSHQDIAIVTGRNTVGYIGFAMLLCALAGPRAASFTTAAIPIVLATTGWAPDGRARPWAWVLQPAQSGLAAGATLALLAAGVTVTLTRPTPARHER